MKAKDFNIFKILEKTYNKMVYPFQTSGEFKEERRKVYLNRGVKIVRSRSS